MERLAHTATVNGVQFVNERRMKMDEVKDYPPYLDYAKPYKRTTNADRIRAMSDEELAKMLTVLRGGFSCLKCREIQEGECSMKCEERCLEWLQQPSEGG